MVAPKVGLNTSGAELTNTISRLLPQITNLLSTDVYIKDNGKSLITNIPLSEIDKLDIQTIAETSSSLSTQTTSSVIIGDF